MFHEYRITIYKGIIQYLLDSTNYSLQRIANLSNASITQLHSIYQHHHMPKERSVELNLLKLFSTIIDMELKGEWNARLQLK